ncbi:MAG: hypothetical protein K6A65_02185, partial [Succinivibrionaceae bacterium]|nr:hypothetical protein [Succinivibrionaceae bacterium]
PAQPPLAGQRGLMAQLGRALEAFCSPGEGVRHHLGELRALLAEAVAALLSRSGGLRGALAALRDPRVGDTLGALHQAATQGSGSPTGQSRACQEALRLLADLTLLYGALEAASGAARVPLYDPASAKDAFALPAPYNSLRAFQALDPGAYSELDCLLFELRDRPLAGDRLRLNKFMLGLELPLSREGAAKFTVEVGGKRQQWGLSDLCALIASHAGDLLPVLGAAGDQPSASRAWAALRPGRPEPSGLSMGSLAGLYMQSVIGEAADYCAMIGRPFSAAVDLAACQSASGLTVDRLVSLMRNCNREAVSLDALALRGAGALPFAHGPFIGSLEGTSFADGSQDFGFALSLTGTRMPAVESAAAEPELFRLAIEGGATFTGREHLRQEGEAGKAAYIHDLSLAVLRLCGGNPLQASAIATCLGPATKASLALGLVRDGTGGSREMTALDYTLSRLDNGRIMVAMGEKPGALVGFRHHYEVDPQGIIHLVDAVTTYPSLSRIQEYNLSHGTKV